jgi:hypothetical protein
MNRIVVLVILESDEAAAKPTAGADPHVDGGAPVPFFSFF